MRGHVLSLVSGFSVFSLIAFSLAACGVKHEEKHTESSEDRSYSYQFNENGCDTEKHSFKSMEEYCAALKNEELNHGCASYLRMQDYKRSCGAYSKSSGSGASGSSSPSRHSAPDTPSVGTGPDTSPSGTTSAPRKITCSIERPLNMAGTTVEIDIPDFRITVTEPISAGRVPSPEVFVSESVLCGKQPRLGANETLRRSWDGNPVVMDHILIYRMGYRIQSGSESAKYAGSVEFQMDRTKDTAGLSCIPADGSTETSVGLIHCLSH